MLKNAVVAGEARAGVLPADALLPDPGRRSRDGDPDADVRHIAATGSSISNAFFWAINRSQDATFFHDSMFSRGNGVGAEYRYVLGPQAQGDFRYYWLDEKEAVINGQPRPARQSTSMRGGLSQDLPLGLAARARVDYISDVQVRQTYDHNFYNATNSTRSY